MQWCRAGGVFGCVIAGLRRPNLRGITSGEPGCGRGQVPPTLAIWCAELVPGWQVASSVGRARVGMTHLVEPAVGRPGVERHGGETQVGETRVGEHGEPMRGEGQLGRARCDSQGRGSNMGQARWGEQAGTRARVLIDRVVCRARLGYRVGEHGESQWRGEAP
ncbi:unnamed protein product [Lota lota]